VLIRTVSGSSRGRSILRAAPMSPNCSICCPASCCGCRTRRTTTPSPATRL